MLCFELSLDFVALFLFSDFRQVFICSSRWPGSQAILLPQLPRIGLGGMCYHTQLNCPLSFLLFRGWEVFVYVCVWMFGPWKC